MSSKEKSSSTSSSSSPSAKATRSMVTHLNEQFAREEKQGFRGQEVDPTPNEAYTVAGVTSGAPTPETDVQLAKDVRQETGLGLSALEAAERERSRGEK
jgi:hypothetical protein